MKKILRLNLIIIELNKRMKDLYFQISFLLKNKFDKLSDIQIKLQLMILLMKNYLDKKIIFESFITIGSTVNSISSFLISFFNSTRKLIIYIRINKKMSVFTIISTWI